MPGALVLVLAVAGCGSSGGSPSSGRSGTAPTAVRPPAPSAQVEAALLARIKSARSCLAKGALHASGGPVYPLQSPTSPDGELIVGSAKGGAFIAFYTSATRAAQLEPQFLRSTQRAAGQVSRRGAVTVLLIHHPAPRVRQTVLTCAFA